jgi:hypothetical protein
MLLQEIILVYTKNQTKLTNTLCEQNTELLCNNAIGVCNYLLLAFSSLKPKLV